MEKILLVLAFLLVAIPATLSCYDHCIQKFSSEIEKSGHQGNSSQMTSNFCRAMTNQVSCLHDVMPSCLPQQRALIQSMLSIFIQPDYQRTCHGGQSNNMMGNGAMWNGGMGNVMSFLLNNTAMTGSGMTGSPFYSTSGAMVPPTMSAPGATPLSPNTQAMLMCSQKVKACQISFNKTFSSFVATYNISGICQSLKEFTTCLMTLVSNDCQPLVSQSQNLVYSLQRQYGGMCSSDAQASTVDMLECINKTMACYSDFNKTFVPALAGSNMIKMCLSLDNYTSCAQQVKATPECEQTALSSLSSIAAMKQRHNLYCGQDNGQTAHRCLQSFQDCFAPFNQTFFPALHRANLPEVCSSLNTYNVCLGRLTTTCIQQLSQMLQSAQALRLQFSEKCHPKILQISQCTELAQCSSGFLQGFSSSALSNTGLCGNIGDYFPCVARSLAQCNLPQTTTVVSFHDLGHLMKGYCRKLSGNSRLLQCPQFVACTTAVLLSFSPNLSNMFEGSTWCTLMQMSIGCAEHALQSSKCSRLSSDVELKQNIIEMDNLRMRTCEAGVMVSDNGQPLENLVDPNHGKSSSKDDDKDDDDDDDDDNDNGVRAVMSSTTHLAILVLLSTCLGYQRYF